MVAFTFATLSVVVIAPLFGYKLDLLVSTFNDIAPAEDESIEAPIVDDAAYGGYTSGSYNARSLQGTSWSAMGSKILTR